MEFIIASLAACGAFGVFFAVFFIKRRGHDGPVRVHTCARQKCDCESNGGEVQILEHADIEETRPLQTH